MGLESRLPIDMDISIVPPTTNRPPATAANYFHCSVSGTEIQLLVGYTDPELVSALAGESIKGSRTFHPEISHRFLVTPRGFELLKEQIVAADEKMSGASEGET